MDKKFYIGNRKNLINSIEDEKCLILVSSGHLINKSADEDYDFQVNTNFYYLTGITQPNVHLLIVKNGKIYNEILFIDEYDENHEKWVGHRLTKKESSEISGVKFTNIDYISNFESKLNSLINEYQIIYLDLEEKQNQTVFGLDMKEKMSNKHNNCSIKDVYTNIIKLRSMKQSCEVTALKKAINVTNKGIKALMKNAKPNMYEYELEAVFDYTIKVNGNKKHSFKTIAASGKNATILHYSKNNCKIKNNDLILFDLGAKEEEYCADITRTFPVNGKFTTLQKTIYQIVLNANKKVEKTAKAGMYFDELQTICIEELTKGCLEANLIKEPSEIKKYYFHSVSHSIGLDTHDPAMRKEKLPVGTVISNEPGLYFPEFNIGIRIEDDLLLLKDKAVNLSAEIIKEIDDIENFMKKHK